MTTNNNSNTNNDIKRAIQSFWLLGLLNNAPWVLMLACATNISSGGVALVFLANQAPGLLTKLSVPFWFHRVDYRTRMKLGSWALGLACFLVGLGGVWNDELANGENDEAVEGDDSNNDDTNKARAQYGLILELLGVSFTSFQCSLGEASLLALAGKFDSSILPKIQVSASSSSCSSPESYSAVESNGDISLTTDENDGNDGLFSSEEYNGNNSNITRINHNEQQQQSSPNTNNNNNALMKTEQQPRKCITAFASGTGFAGIIGYGYKSLLSELFGWRMSYVMWSAIVFAVVYFRVYCGGLYELERRLGVEEKEDGGLDGASSLDESELNESIGQSSSLEMITQPIEEDEERHSATLLSQHSTESTATSVYHMTTCERLKTVLSLWPYMIPLFFVYLTEYMMQAGVWPAIGFPDPSSATARAQFYHYANWTYQVGVFLSRSSGNLCTVSLTMLWIMPLLQLVNLCFFWFVSIHHFWYDYSLLIVCFVVGLLGGGVYVQGYNRINVDMPKELREFALSSASLADSVGILVADIASLYIQSCIYERNGLDGAVVSCPL